MGWNVTQFPGLERCDVKLSPSDNEIHELLSKRQEDSIHFFSGIHGYPFVTKVLDISLKYNVKRGIITERPNTFKFGLANGKPLWLHRIRFLFRIESMQNIFNMCLQWGKMLSDTSALYGKIGKYFLSFTVQIVKIKYNIN